MPEPLAEQFPPLSRQDALSEAHRCLYCYDAPCTQACPTHIDIPRFIKKISTENLSGSAETILQANLLGATCARVCPVQELCEGACVLGPGWKPIAIGRLQRYAMDDAARRGVGRLLRCATPTGKRVAVIGAGPAGLSCAGALALRGHEVVLFDKRALAGGLSTYGIIALREPVETALAEAEMIRHMGVCIETGKEVGIDITVNCLREQFDALFVGAGLGITPLLGIPGEEHTFDGLDYISRGKLAPETLPPAGSVLVIGAGNTAIDCATVAKRRGAEKVTMIYRRAAGQMTAYEHEVRFIQNEGVAFEFLAQPQRVLLRDGQVAGLECSRTRLTPHPEPVPDSSFVLPADQIIRAIGQTRPSLAALLGVATEHGFIQVDQQMETSVAGIFAGGDCVRVKGAASTVMAVQDGKRAAEAIHRQVLARG